MIEEIITALEKNTRVTVFTKHGEYTGRHVNTGIGEDPAKPGTDLDYLVLTSTGYVDVWIPQDAIRSILIHTQEANS